MESIVANTLMGMPASDGARSVACHGSGRSLAPSYRSWPLANGANFAQAIKPATAMFVDVQTDHRTRRLWGTS
jgi:hypothetical protein